MATIRRQRDKWQAQIRRRGIKPVTSSFLKKSDAIAWANVTESEIVRGVYIDIRRAESISIAELIDRYLESLPEDTKHKQSRISHSKPLRGSLGCYSLAKLSSTHLAKYRDQRLEVVSPMSVVHELSFLHRILVLATTEWGYPLPSAIPCVSLPKRPNGRERRLSAIEEIAAERFMVLCNVGKWGIKLAVTHNSTEHLTVVKLAKWH